MKEILAKKYFRAIFYNPATDLLLTKSLPSPYLLLLRVFAMERKKSGQGMAEVAPFVGEGRHFFCPIVCRNWGFLRISHGNLYWKFFNVIVL